MARTQRAPNSVAALATVSALAATVALIAIMVGSMFWFWAAGLVFVGTGVAAVVVAAGKSSAESRGTYEPTRSASEEPSIRTMPPPETPVEGRQPPAP